MLNSYLTGVLAVFLVAVNGLESSAGFITAPNYAAGDSPSAVAVGDFNGDGISDLAVTNYAQDGTVGILLGKGDGTFQPLQMYAAGPYPLSVVVGDFNGDGFVDLAVTSAGDWGIGVASGAVSVLLGNGDGTFQPAKSYPTGGAPVFVALGDFDGDGNLDLVVANIEDEFLLLEGSLSILQGNGDGTFRAAQNLAVGPARFVAVADFDRDGHVDLVVADSGSDTVSILLGNGDGTFQSAQSYAVGGVLESVAVGDFNGDGIMDLVLGVANEGSATIQVLLGQGDGSFQAPVNFYVESFPQSVVVADINGDGIPDLVLAGSAVTILLGGGDGTFLAGQSYGYGGPVAVADFNGDRKLDLAAVGGSGVNILLGKGDGTFPQAARSYAATAFVQSFVVADFNGDGKLDLVVLNAGGPYTADITATVLLGTGDGDLQPTERFAAGIHPASVAVADFNGDGHLDLAAGIGDDQTGNGSGANLLLGNGDGTFQSARLYLAGFHPSSIAVGDFNGDGHPDLAVTDPGGTLSILLGIGDGTFEPQQSYRVGRFPTSLAVGDFNGDGTLDLAVADEYIGVIILLGKGDGTFGAPKSYAAGANARPLAVGDFNRDGYLDLAVGGDDSDDSTVSILLGKGDGTFKPAVSYPVPRGGGCTSLAVADFNGDGFLDIVAAGPGSDTVSVFLGKGDGTFQATQSYSAGAGPWSVAVGDFNGDGFPDIAVGGSGVTVLLNDTHWGGG
jgi:hypothetical protein